MAGAAGHAMRLAASAADGFLDLIDKKRIHGYCALAQQYVLPERQAAAFGNFMGLSNECVDRSVANVIGLVAHIESHASFGGNHIGGAGFCFDLANGRYKAWVTLRRALDRDDPLRGGGDGVVPEMHGRRARVIGAAQKLELHARLRGDGIDRSERPADGFEDWSLLDVKFQIGERVVAQGRARNV